MAKVGTDEMKAAALDWAVLKAQLLQATGGRVVLVGETLKRYTVYVGSNGRKYLLTKDGFTIDFSEDWRQGGPLLEQAMIETSPWNQELRGGRLCAKDWRGRTIESVGRDGEGVVGPTKLIAELRCLVKSTLGDVIEVPDEVCADATR